MVNANTSAHAFKKIVTRYLIVPIFLKLVLVTSYFVDNNTIKTPKNRLVNCLIV